MDLSKYNSDELKKMGIDIRDEVQRRERSERQVEADRLKDIQNDKRLEDLRKDYLKIFEGKDVEVNIDISVNYSAYMWTSGNIRHGELEVECEDECLLMGGDDLTSNYYGVNEKIYEHPKVIELFQKVKADVLAEAQRLDIVCRARDLANEYELDEDEVWDMIAS